MNRRRLVLFSSVCLVLLVGVTMLAILARDSRGNKVTVSFVNAEISNGQFPTYAKSERLAFAVRNAGTKPAFLDVSQIEDEHGRWAPSRHVLGEAEAGQSTQLYLYLPLEPHPRSLRVRVYEQASTVRKTRYALKLLLEKASGRYAGKQVWFDALKVPAREFIVSLDNETETDGAANGSQPGVAASRR
jgi:hypothetical protein